MISGSYQSVMQARNREEFRAEIIRFTRQLGFQTVSAMVVIDRTLGKSEFITIDNTPQAYLDSYVDEIAGKRDPVSQHCKKASLPIIWNQDTYVSQGLGDKWEHQAKFGYATGIAMALHLPEGRHFMLGVDRDQDLPADPSELQRVVADLQLFAVCAQETAFRLLVPPASQLERPRLTPRELEALRWTMEGKTAWEVGALMGISERTAVLHVNNAMHKLDCANKHQAVLKALKLGLIY